jgi:serine/threonine protein kinase
MQQSMRGQTFAGYVVQEEIGQGGMSTVYRAQDTQLRRDVALKVFSSALTEGSDQFVARFQSEAQILAGLEHPYIVPLYAHGIENGQPYIVQRLVRGGSLRNVIAGAPSDLDDLARIIGQVAAALDYAHERSVMHLDLKPENILLDDSGNALIADFGLTRLFKTELTESAIVGTPTYLSPEQARGDATGSHTDIYTLGVVMYEAITGEPPFMGDSPMAIIMQHVTETPRPVTEIRRDVPEAVNEVIAKALAKDPEDRYEFAGALARDFEQAIRSAPMQQQVQQQAQEPQIQQMLEGFEEKNIPPPPPPVPTFTYTGKTIDEAIQNGLRDRRRPRDEVEITIIDEPRGGVLGIGGRDAKIELTEKMPPIVDPDELVYTLEFTEPEVIRGQRINIYPGNSIVLAPRRMLPLAEDVGVSGPDGESIETTDYGFDDDNLGRGRITFIRRGDELISLGYFTIQRGQGEITNQNSRALKVMAGDTISDSSRIERGTFSFTIHCNHTATLHVTSPPAPAPQQQQISKRASSINIPDLEPKVRMITLNNLNRVILQRDPDLWKTPAAGDRRIPADTDFAVARRDGAFYAVGRFDVPGETALYNQNTPLPFGREITIHPHDSDTELIYFAPEQLRDLWAEQDGVANNGPSDVDMFLNTTMGDYTLQEIIAVGGMARIYLGIDQKLLRKAAIKVLDLEQEQTDEILVHRFEQEAKSMAMLNHENIISIYQYGQYRNSAYYIAMQYIEGQDLRQLLAAYREHGEQIPIEQGLHIMRQVAAALDYAHRSGVIHRDIKPSNVLLDKNQKAILTDFGLVLRNDSTTTGTAFGTPRYIAPEQAISSAQVVPQSDIYSFAIVMYEILTGVIPFDGDTPMEIALQHITDEPPAPSHYRDSIPHSVDVAILRALSKYPSERYNTATDFVEAVAEGYRATEQDDVVAGTGIGPADSRSTTSRRGRRMGWPLRPHPAPGEPGPSGHPATAGADGRPAQPRQHHHRREHRQLPLPRWHVRRSGAVEPHPRRGSGDGLQPSTTGTCRFC